MAAVRWESSALPGGQPALLAYTLRLLAILLLSPEVASARSFRWPLPQLFQGLCSYNHLLFLPPIAHLPFLSASSILRNLPTLKSPISFCPSLLSARLLQGAHDAFSFYNKSATNLLICISLCTCESFSETVS